MINSIFGSYRVLERDYSKTAAARYWKVKYSCGNFGQAGCSYRGRI